MLNTSINLFCAVFVSFERRLNAKLKVFFEFWVVRCQDSCLHEKGKILSKIEGWVTIFTYK